MNGTTCWGEVDLSTSDLFGFRAMQGGVDGDAVSRPLHAITPTKLLVTEMLAHDAARFGVDADFERPAAERRLLGLVEPSTTEDAVVREQIAALFLHVLGRDVPPDHGDVSLYADLWTEVHAGRGGDAHAAWTVVMATLLQDPEVLFY